MSEAFRGTQDELISECASAFIFNTIFVANNEDEGGLDYPLEAPYVRLNSLVEQMLNDKVFKVADYEEDGERGRELVPGPQAKTKLNELIKISEYYLGKTCEGLDALRQGFYLAMHEGRLCAPAEEDHTWVAEILNIEFYKTLAPEASVPTTPKLSSTASPTQNESTVHSQKNNSAHSHPSPTTFSEPVMSAIDLNTRPEESTWPPKTYLYKKSALSWLAVTAVVHLLGRMGGSSLFFWGSFICAGLTLFYAYRKVIISPQSIRLISLAGNKTIELEDLEESTLQETEGQISSLQLVSRRGDSLKLSTWMDDLNGAYHLLRRFKEIQ